MVVSPDVRIERLGPRDRERARRTFELLTEVFKTPGEPLSDGYVRRLLDRPEFWVLAAIVGDEIVGGLTAHELPTTRNESTELFIYDVAVHPAFQRRGIGRQLMTTLLALAAKRGIDVTFVPADNEDDHALAFYEALGGVAAPVTMFDF